MSVIVHPINAFNPKIQEIINHYSEVKGYPHEYFLTAMLSACSTSLGRAITLNTGNYTAIGIIWAIIVGKPGVIKSEALTDAFRPVKQAQFTYFKEYERDLAELEEQKARNPKMKTELPDPKKFLISDITPEALSITLSKNPKGCGIIYDELAGFVSRFNRYNSGGDEQMFLSLFNGDTIIRTRVNGHGNAAIKNSFLSISGTIQPAILKSTFNDKQDSGFFDRWLIAAPENVKKQYPNSFGVHSEIERAYEDIIYRLLGLDYDDRRLAMSYTTESHKIIYDYQCRLIDTQNSTESDSERSILAKMEIYLHRFALLLQCISYASDEYTDPSKLNFVSEDSSRGAIVLTEYYLSEAKKVRVMNPVELLKDKWIDIYGALPDHGDKFDRKQFVKVCAAFGIRDRQADNFLREHGVRSETSLLFKVGHGVYTKNLF